jgi:dihydroxyacid dehydratase/phosphogluconate dehydratase
VHAGLTEADMNKPQVGIASMWYEGNPCNMHLLNLAEEVKRGVVRGGWWAGNLKQSLDWDSLALLLRVL